MRNGRAMMHKVVGKAYISRPDPKAPPKPCAQWDERSSSGDDEFVLRNAPKTILNCFIVTNILIYTLTV